MLSTEDEWLELARETKQKWQFPNGFAAADGKHISIQQPYLSDLSGLFFPLDSDIANYADDNTPYATSKDIESVIKRLESDSIILFQWIGNNALKANPDKSHLLLNSKDNHLSVTIDDHEIFNSEHKKLLGITIDSELKFDEHVNSLCKKASQKLNALSRVSHFMNEDKRRVLMKAFIESQFGYCPLVWMFCSRTLNNRINRIHERALRLVYNDYENTFQTLLSRDKSFTVHEKKHTKVSHRTI